MKVLVLVKATEQSESGDFGPPEEFAAMGLFNEELMEAGVMLAADGLQPSSRGKRVAFDADGNSTVIDGPFTETKELIAGFWIWEVASMDEAVQWIKRSPFRDNEIELRKIYDAEDFGDFLPADVAAAEKQMRAELAAKK
jgi:hypothetical protein